MIGKNEQLEDDNANGQRVNLMSEKRKSLEDTSLKVKEEVRACFERLSKVLRTREKQLLRQIEAIHNQQLTIVQSNLEIPCSVPSIRINFIEKQDLEEFILKFGELSSSDRNSIDVRDAEPYKIEDYEDADRDHVTLDKSLKSDYEDERTIEVTEKLDDSPESPCDSSLDASSEVEAISENEITVLTSHNYYFPSSEGLKELVVTPNSSITGTKHDFSSNDEIVDEKLLNNSSNWELNLIAQTIITNGDFIVPETSDYCTVDNFDKSKKYDCEISSKKRAKNLSTSGDSGSPVETFEANGDVLITSKKAQDCEKHPKQIQQWLRQILVETETEPTIHEIEQFAEISKSRFKEFQFPLET